MNDLPEYPTLADLESYQFEITRNGPTEVVHFAELTYKDRPDLAEQGLLKHYLHAKNPPWETYQIVRISHWDEERGRWVGRKVRGALVRRDAQVAA